MDASTSNASSRKLFLPHRRSEFDPRFGGAHQVAHPRASGITRESRNSIRAFKPFRVIREQPESVLHAHTGQIHQSNGVNTVLTADSYTLLIQCGGGVVWALLQHRKRIGERTDA